MIQPRAYDPTKQCEPTNADSGILAVVLAPWGQTWAAVDDIGTNPIAWRTQRQLMVCSMQLVARM